MPKFRLKNRFHSRSEFEPTYAEMVKVVNGIATCKTDAAKRALMSRGYDLMPEPEPKPKKTKAKKKKAEKKD